MTTDIRISELKLHQKSRLLEIAFEDGERFSLTCEYLRIYSPSAEVRGHGHEPMKLEVGKKNVNISAIEPVGNYGVKLIFDDGHQTGIYSWQTLYDLAINHDKNWEQYLTRLNMAGMSQEP